MAWRIRMLVISVTKVALLVGGVGEYVLHPRHAFGDEWSLSGKVDQRFEVDDNIRLRTSGSDTTYGSITSPELRVRGRSPVLDVNLFAKLDFAFFNQSELNTDDQLLRLASTYSTERSIWALDAELDRDSTRTSELTDTGNFDDISRRFRYSILPSWTAIITPRNRLRLNAGYTDVSYDTSTLSDYTYVTGGATWLHEYTEKTELNLRLTGGHYEANDTNSESDVIAFLVGATHSFSPKLKISGSIGPSYLSTESPTQSEDSVGLQFAGSAEYLLNERTSFLGSIERAISPSGGGAPIERDTIKFSGKHQFHPRWSLLFTATYIHNDESTSSGQDGRDYVSIEPTARYQLSQNFDLSASYRYRRQEIGDGLEAHSNAAFITLTYRAMPWVFGN